MCVSALPGAEAGAFEWQALRAGVGVFTPDLGMMDSERDDYATHLANHTANRIAESKASPAALAEGRRLLGLALHLSPRNRRAVVLNFQLSKGILPERVAADYSPPVFARLLFTRGQLLEEQGGDENSLLARFFVQIAAEIDPKNEDAVYASEVHRLDHGEPDWGRLFDAKPKRETTP